MSEFVHKRMVADIPIIHFDELTSTNDIALQAVSDSKQNYFDLGEPIPEKLFGVISANHQNKGRGRLDRQWEDKPNSSMLATFVIGLSIEKTMLDVARLMVIVANTLRDSNCAVSIKWPNDLVHEKTEKKLGGCLTEISSNYLLVGVGINISENAYPGSIKDIATSLSENGLNIDASSLIDNIVGNYTNTQLSKNEVFEKYLELCVTIGRQVHIELLDESYDGQAIDLCSDGSLVVEKENGNKVMLSVGDVIHLRS